MLKIKKKTANIWEYKTGNNANIANLCICENPECNTVRAELSWHVVVRRIKPPLNSLVDVPLDFLGSDDLTQLNQ